MTTVIFVAIGAAPLDRFEMGAGAVVGDFLNLLKERGVDVAELMIFKEDHDEPLGHHHPLHSHPHPIFHAHRCHRVEVKVHYKTEVFEHRFAPSATIASITRWAVEKAALGPAEGQEHVLQVSGSRIQPPQNEHLGRHVADGCHAAFDLVRKKLVQG